MASIGEGLVTYYKDIAGDKLCTVFDREDDVQTIMVVWGEIAKDFFINLNLSLNVYASISWATYRNKFRNIQPIPEVTPVPVAKMRVMERYCSLLLQEPGHAINPEIESRSLYLLILDTIRIDQVENCMRYFAAKFPEGYIAALIALRQSSPNNEGIVGMFLQSLWDKAIAGCTQRNSSLEPHQKIEDAFDIVAKALGKSSRSKASLHDILTKVKNEKVAGLVLDLVKDIMQHGRLIGFINRYNIGLNLPLAFLTAAAMLERYNSRPRLGMS